MYNLAAQKNDKSLYLPNFFTIMAAKKNNKNTNNPESTQKRAKTGGRKAGTPNKVTKALRDVLGDLSREYFGDGINLQVTDPEDHKKKQVIIRFSEDLLLMKPSDRSDRMIKLLPYITPKYQTISFSADSGRSITAEEQILAAQNTYDKLAITINTQRLKIHDFS